MGKRYPDAPAMQYVALQLLGFGLMSYGLYKGAPRSWGKYGRIFLSSGGVFGALWCCDVILDIMKDNK